MQSDSIQNQSVFLCLPLLAQIKRQRIQNFHEGKITEKKLGDILATVELDYLKIDWAAQVDFSSHKINEVEFKKTVKEARRIWLRE